MLKSHKNYYEILGVTPDIELFQLKSIYRRLVRKYHPDVNPDGETFFKDITEAYEVLSDEKLKKQYDTINGFFKSSKKADHSEEVYRKTFRKATEPSFEKKDSAQKSQTENINESKKIHNEKPFTDVINDIIDGFSQKNKKTSKNKKPESKKGADIYADVRISLKESITGTHKLVNIITTSICPKCGGRKFINGAKCPECSGKGEITQHQKINVTIPANIKNSSKLRLPGEGKKGMYGGKNGDLYLKITIEPDSFFKVDGIDLLCEVPISPYEAVLGGDIKIPSFNSEVTLTLPKFTKAGQVFRISGAGLKKNNLVGDIIVTVKIQIPDSISEKEIVLYKALKDISGASLRKNLI